MKKILLSLFISLSIFSPAMAALYFPDTSPAANPAVSEYIYPVTTSETGSFDFIYICDFPAKRLHLTTFPPSIDTLLICSDANTQTESIQTDWENNATRLIRIDICAFNDFQCNIIQETTYIEFEVPNPPPPPPPQGFTHMDFSTINFAGINQDILEVGLAFIPFGAFFLILIISIYIIPALVRKFIK